MTFVTKFYRNGVPTVSVAQHANFVVLSIGDADLSLHFNSLAEVDELANRIAAAVFARIDRGDDE